MGNGESTGMSDLLKTVFHVHTDYSFDCDTSVEALLAEAQAKGVGCLTVTDHDTIEGARAAVTAAAGTGIKVIVGQEISTAQGHLIGLFLHEPIEPWLPARRTAELIRRQGGLVVVPHPFNRMFGCSLREAVHDILDLTDVVEVCNSQNLLSGPNRRAMEFAREAGLPALVGVDSHQPGHLDSCHQFIEPFHTPREFLESVRRAHYIEGRHGLGYFAKVGWYTLLEKAGLPLPARYGRNSSGRPVAVPLGTVG
ncbi:MAG: hypothetical protein AMXMBFR13_30960 [Phycisphaerae bacterium]